MMAKTSNLTFLSLLQANIGQDEDFDAVRAKALKFGARKVSERESVCVCVMCERERERAWVHVCVCKYVSM